jgi:hypothetical protein
MSTLAPELWFHIIQLATPFYIISDYIPFEEQRTPRHDDILRDKRSFALVCKTWNRIVSPMLAEDIRFVRPQEPHLKSFVLGSVTIEPRGHLVRRLQLAYSHEPDSVASLLASCPNIEYLRRPYSSAKYPIHHPSFANCLRFTSLTRLDWFCVARKTDSHETMHTTAALHSLVDVMKQSPNLRYLSISGKGSHWPLVPLTHPNVQTLRIGRLPLRLDESVSRWNFPSIQYLILEHLPTECLRKFSRQVHTVEFAPRLCLRRDNSIRSLNLNAKENVRRINCSVLFFPRLWRGEYHHVREIGLDLRVTEIFAQQGENSLWTAIRSQLSWFDGSEGCGFVHAELIEFHGDWSRWEKKEEFIEFKEVLKARGTELRYL